MIAAMLNSVKDISEKVAYYIKFAEEKGIQVLPPNINESYGKFTVKGDVIIFGIGALLIGSSFIMLMLYNYTIIRYLILFLILFIGICLRNRIIALFKKIKEDSK